MSENQNTAGRKVGGEGRVYATVTALAAELGLSQGSVSKYLGRPDWPAARLPPWNDGDVIKINDWRFLLQEDRSGKGRPPQEAAERATSADVRARRPGITRAESIITIESDEALALALPRRLCTPAERAVLEGDRPLDRNEQKTVVRAGVLLKFHMMDFIEDLPAAWRDRIAGDVESILRVHAALLGDL